MASITTSAQHIGINSPESMSQNRLDSESIKANKVMFNKAFSDDIAADPQDAAGPEDTAPSVREQHGEPKRSSDLVDTSGNSMPPIGRQLPADDGLGQALGLSNEHNVLADARPLKWAEGLQTKMPLSAGQFLQSLATTPSPMSIDALAVTSGHASPGLEGGLASVLINSNNMADMDLKETVLNINTRLNPSVDLRSSTVGHNGLQASATLPTSSIYLSINHPQWGAQFQQRMNWLVGQTISRAEIHLNPPELGALQVRIDQRQDSTVVSIISQNATTRELLESNASRLKELFSDQGLELLDVEVNDGEQQAPSADPYSSADFAFVDAAKDERLSAESDFIANKEAANISGIVLRYGSVDTFV